MYELRQLKPVCLSIPIMWLSDKGFLYKCHQLSAALPALPTHGQRGSINTLHTEEVLSEHTSSTPPWLSGNDPCSLQGTRAPRNKTLQSGWVWTRLCFDYIWDNEFWSNLPLFHMTEWEYKDSDNGRKWFHLHYNATRWISYQTLFIFHFLKVQFILSKTPNCLTSKCEKKFPLRQIQVISAQGWAWVLIWGMQVRILL